MAKKYISLGQLSIASELLDFVNNELLPDTGVTKENFWSGLDKCFVWNGYNFRIRWGEPWK